MPDGLRPASLAEHHHDRRRSVSAHRDAVAGDRAVHPLPIHPADLVEHQAVQTLRVGLRDVMRHVGRRQIDDVIPFAGLLQRRCQCDGRGRGLVAHHDRYDPRVRVDVLQERHLDLDRMLVRVRLRDVRDALRQLPADVLVDRARPEGRQERLPADRVDPAHAVMVGTDHHVRVGTPVLLQPAVDVRCDRAGRHVAGMGHHGPAYAPGIAGIARKTGGQRAPEAILDDGPEAFRVGRVEASRHCRISHRRG